MGITFSNNTEKYLEILAAIKTEINEHHHKTNLNYDTFECDDPDCEVEKHWGVMFDMTHDFFFSEIGNSLEEALEALIDTIRENMELIGAQKIVDIIDEYLDVDINEPNLKN